MSVTQIAEKDQGPGRHKFPGPRVPPNLFGIALAIAGLAQAWHAAVPVLGTVQAVPGALDVLAAAHGWSWPARTWPRAPGSSWPTPSPALAHLIIDEQGFARLPEEDFVGHFAADVDPVRARVMWAVQQPLSASALQEVMGVPAWKSRPSWFLVAAGNQAIPPEAERQFAARMGATTVEVPSNHVAMVSHP